MKSTKAVLGLILGALLIAALGGGITYLVVTLQEKRLARELQLARSYLNQKDYPNADKVLTSMSERAKGTEAWYAQLLAMRLDLEREQDKADAATATAQAILDPEKKFKGEPVIMAHLFLGQQALEREDADGARPHFDEVLKITGGAGYGSDMAKLGLIRIRMAVDGVTTELQQELQGLLDQAVASNSPARDDIEFALGHCNLALLLSPNQMEGDQIHTIAKGDSIYSLARNYKVPQEIIMRVNGITNPSRLSIGQRLKIPQVDFSIIVDKTNNTLTLNNNGKFFKRYLVRTGKVDYLTPMGEYKIQNKKVEPDWTEPKTGKHFTGGDPANELGSRWLGFQGANLGIHGTNKPESIGTYASNGCIGMQNEDVEELFDLVKIGTPLKVVGKVQDGGKVKVGGSKLQTSESAKPGAAAAQATPTPEAQATESSAAPAAAHEPAAQAEATEGAKAGEPKATPKARSSRSVKAKVKKAN